MSEERLVFLHGINMERYCGYEEDLHGGAFGFVRKHGFGYEKAEGRGGAMTLSYA